MHILRIYRRFPPLIGGIENHVFYLSRENLKHHDLSLIIPRMRYRALNNSSRLNLRTIPVPYLKDFTEYPFPKVLFHHSHYLLFLFLSFVSAVRIHSNKKIDLIHLHGAWAEALLGFFLKIFLRVPVILTVHGSISGGLSKYFCFQIKYIDHFIIVSNSIEPTLIKYGIHNKRISTITSGISTENLEKFIIQGQNKKYDLLFVGRIRPVKGLEYLIKAISLLKNDIIVPKLNIVGSSPIIDHYKKMVLKYGVDHLIVFTGKISHTKMGKYYSQAKIFVLPSIIDKFEGGEGTPSALLEALYFGLPIIATNIGGIANIVTHNFNGMLVEEKNSKELAIAIRTMLKNPSMLEKMGKNSKKISHQYTWEKIGKKIEQIYVKIRSSK